MGLEVPILCEPVYPGDRFRIGLTYQMQLAPMLNPVYDGLEVNFEAFYVPNRIIDRRWKEFWTGYNEYDQMTPSDLAPLTLGTVGFSIENGDPIGDMDKPYNLPLGIGSLADFLGIQFRDYLSNGLPAINGISLDASTFSHTMDVNALPFLAYSRIFDDWYRNERVQRARLYSYYNNEPVSARKFDAQCYYNNSGIIEDDPDSPIPVTLFMRNYKRDRFTTALPEPIIGGDVRIPVNEDLSANGAIEQGNVNGVISGTQGDFSLNALALGTIEQLKFAFKEYSYRMKDTYNGNRYNESIQSHYGVRVPDSTLQRAIYLGSARDYVNFGEVYQTSSGDGQGENGALGDYAGRGAAAGSNLMFDETFYEHGFVFILMCITPMNRYFQGVKRMFTRFDRADYFEPEYQNIGDDFINENELFNDGSNYADSGIFGYNSRWIELKTRYNELHGEFANPNSQMFTWNFARSFDEMPAISEEFSRILPINKPFVSTDIRDDNYMIDVYFNFDALRPVLAVESF